MIATASAKDRDFLSELGAAEVIDYARERFEEKVHDVDVVLDSIGGETRERSWGVLRRGGVLVSIVGPVPAEKAASLGVRGSFFIVKPSHAQLIEMGDLIDKGVLRVVVGAVFPLANARAAFERGPGGHKPGKIVLQVAAAESARA